MNESEPKRYAPESLEQIFAQAIEIESPAERKQFVDKACGSNLPLRTHVECLLQSHERADDLFDADANLAETLIPLPRVPESLGEFQIIREIGRGGMGIVYEAQQQSLNRRVALKVLSVGLDFSNKSIARFQREAEAAARLHHTNIVPVYTTGVADQLPYFAMELVRGPSLDLVLRQLRGEPSGIVESQSHAAGDGSPDSGTAPPAPDMETVINAQDDTLATSPSFGAGADYFLHVARTMAEVADAIEHAHQEGVIHRDIKPSNLLLGPDGHLRISDFGLARIAEEPGVTITGEQMGSPRYMSPEQISPAVGQIDHRTDIYSLGVTLYEMMTLARAFDGDERDRIFTQVLQKDPKAPRKVDSKIPRDLETICQKAMDKLPARRYQKASELADDLRRFANRQTIAARRIGSIGKTIRWCERNRSFAVVTMLLVVVFCTGASLVAWQHVERQRRWGFAVREIESDVETDPWRARLTIESALQQFPRHRETLMALLEKIGRKMSIDSEPPDAEISVRPQRLESGRWLPLGKTPLTTNLPLDDFHVRATTDGRYELVVVRSSSPDVPDRWQLRMPTRQDMVRVSKLGYEDMQNACHIAWLMDRKIPPSIAEFQLDRHEVTNGEYQAFVDAGGYDREEFWVDTLGKSWNDVVSTFTDRKHQYRAPALWADGTFPKGMEDHPVAGVSWYEAMAYAKWAGKQLPSLFHWLRGADYNGWGRDYDSHERYNIGNQRLTSRSVHDGLRSATAHGVIDAQGNVKEWCVTEEHDGAYYAMGGSWRDDDGSGYDPVTFPAMQRPDDVGFRCAIYDPRPEWTAAMPIEWRDIRSEPKPIEVEYVKQFQFDRAKPWNTLGPETTMFQGVEAQRVQFDAAYNVDGQVQRISCYIIFPDRTKYVPPYQVMLGTSPIFLDDAGNPRTDDKRFRNYSPMMNGGRALVLPTLWGNAYDRPAPSFDPLYPDPKHWRVYSEGVVKMAKDIIRTVDFLHAEYPRVAGAQLLDMNRLIFVSCACLQSECMIVADKLVTNDNRFAAAFFCMGGIRNLHQPPEVDQLTYLPYLDTPTVILNEEGSVFLPLEFSQRGMLERLPLPPEHKKLYPIPKFHWWIPLEYIDREVNSWLDQVDTLGKPLSTRGTQS